MHAKKRVGDAEFLRALVEDAQLLIVGMHVEAAPIIGDRLGVRGTRVLHIPRRRRRAAFKLALAQAPLQGFLDEPLLERRREPMQHLAWTAHGRCPAASESRAAAAPISALNCA